MVVAYRPSEVVQVEKRKYPTSVRRTFEAWHLGSDHWGEWLSVPSEEAVLLLPNGEWWVAWFREDGSRRVDIAAEVADHGDRRSFVDLDLDVECDADGTIEILDEDQFAERCDSYPSSWVERARRCVTEVTERITRRDGPFGAAGTAWLASALVAPTPG